MCMRVYCIIFFTNSHLCYVNLVKQLKAKIPNEVCIQLQYCKIILPLFYHYVFLTPEKNLTQKTIICLNLPFPDKQF